MKAITKVQNGVAVGEVDKPTPGKGEILIEVALTGFCRTDSYVAQGVISSSNNVILGHEFSGRVSECGEGVSAYKVGDRVAVMPILKDAEGNYLGKMLGQDLNGGYADFCCVPEEMVYKISNKVSFKHAAYAEPLAASLAVIHAPIDKKSKGLVLGTNRIAKLTHYLMEMSGFTNVEMISLGDLKGVPDNTYDFGVETYATTEYLGEIIRTLKPKGVCVLKSRSKQGVVLKIGDVVEKDILISGHYYSNFGEVVKALEDNTFSVDEYLGDTVSLEDGVKILMSSLDSFEEKKIFFTNNFDLCAE